MSCKDCERLKAKDHGYKDGTFMPRATNRPRRLGRSTRKVKSDAWQVGGRDAE